MKNRIKKQGMVDWRNCKWLQPDGLKTQTATQKEKLKMSLRNNGFASPFLVWESGKQIYILDGHHREAALKEMADANEEIPAKLPAIFIDAKNKKEAQRLLAVYGSHYSDFDNIIAQKFFEALNLSIDEIEIHGFSFDEKKKKNTNTEKEIAPFNLENKCPKCGYEF